MYVPRHFRHHEQSVLIEVMRSYPFATIVGTINGFIHASHIPVVVEEHNEVLDLHFHVSGANPLAQLDNGHPLLIIFQGPHAYVSPAWYSNPQSVPTWDYVAVHAQGKCQIHADDASIHAGMERLIQTFEPRYLEHYRQLDPKYTEAMYRSIRSVSMRVEHLDGAFKLSQNKPEADRQVIANELLQGDYNEQGVVDWMKKLRIIPSE